MKSNNQTVADYAFNMAIKVRDFTEEQAKEYSFHGCRRRNGNSYTTYYFSHTETGTPLSVAV